jgi:hypothetical protein
VTARSERARRWWRAFAHSPFYPAAVVSLLVAASSALFAGSYTYAIADPTPRHLPVALVADAETPQTRAFLASLERRLDTSLDPRAYPSYPQAVDGVEGQHVFAIVRGHERVGDLDIADAEPAGRGATGTRMGGANGLVETWVSIGTWP